MSNVVSIVNCLHLIIIHNYWHFYQCFYCVYSVWIPESYDPSRSKCNFSFTSSNRLVPVFHDVLYQLFLIVFKLSNSLVVELSCFWHNLVSYEFLFSDFSSVFISSSSEWHIISVSDTDKSDPLMSHELVENDLLLFLLCHFKSSTASLRVKSCFISDKSWSIRDAWKEKMKLLQFLTLFLFLSILFVYYYTLFNQERLKFQKGSYTQTTHFPCLL